MSIIERAVELLRPGPIRPEPKHERGDPAGSDKAEMQRPDMIERAYAQVAEELQVSPDGELPQESGSTDRPPRSSSEATLHFAVDKDRLRALNVITPDGARTPLAESFRRIKRQILANRAKPKSAGLPANLILVTSALPGEGKTFCAVNLAISMAMERDLTVLLVDADVARPSVPRLLGLQAERGLMDVLLHRDIDLESVLWQTDIGGLAVLPAGTAHQHATEFLASDAMRRLLRYLAERHPDRVVVFDSPPLLAASEAGALASHVGQIVVVVEAGKTSEAVLKHALGRIDTSRVTGLLLNKAAGTPLEYSYDAYG